MKRPSTKRKFYGNIKGGWRVPKKKVIAAARELKHFNLHFMSKKLGVNRGTALKYLNILLEEGVVKKTESCGRIMWVFVGD